MEDRFMKCQYYNLDLKPLAGFLALKMKMLKCNAMRRFLHCENRLTIFPSPAGMSLTKLSLAGNTLFIPGQGEFGK
jgi:hypothetical protein